MIYRIGPSADRAVRPLGRRRVRLPRPALRVRRVAEDLTSEIFIAASPRSAATGFTDLTVAWLIGVARHKLIDQWRRAEREQRKLALVPASDLEDPWEAHLDAAVAHRRWSGSARRPPVSWCCATSTA